MGFMNWSNLQHAIGDMFDEEELQTVKVQLPDGSIAHAVRFEQHDRTWRLVLEPKADDGGAL
jgi:hypothetical protein